MDRMQAIELATKLERRRLEHNIPLPPDLEKACPDNFGQRVDESLLTEFKELHSKYGKVLDELINQILNEFVGTLESEE